MYRGLTTTGMVTGTASSSGILISASSAMGMATVIGSMVGIARVREGRRDSLVSDTDAEALTLASNLRGETGVGMFAKGV